MESAGGGQGRRGEAETGRQRQAGSQNGQRAEQRGRRSGAQAQARQGVADELPACVLCASWAQVCSSSIQFVHIFVAMDCVLLQFRAPVKPDRCSPAVGFAPIFSLRSAGLRPGQHGHGSRCDGCCARRRPGRSTAGPDCLSSQSSESLPAHAAPAGAVRGAGRECSG